ncbi:retroviral aspartyl protease, partial [Gregarina niphandrodes]
MDLESLAKYFNDSCDRVKEQKAKAAAKKNEPMAGAVNVASEQESGGLYGRFVIADTQVTCLVDPGADKNIISWQQLQTLPLEYRCLWRPNEDGEMMLNFIQGSCEVVGTINLPVISPLGNVEMEFCIVKDARLNILGNPWMRTLSAAICFKNDEVRNEIGQLPLFTGEMVTYADVFSTTQSIVDVNILSDLKQNLGETLSDATKSRIVDILEKYSEAWKKTRVACSKNFVYRIDTGEATPIVEPHRHFAPKTLEELKRLTRELLEAGAIRRSTSNWLSQPVIVAKKDGSSRLCVDFRSLNAVTKSDPFNAPDAAAIIRQLGHSKLFVVMDLKNSFNQMKIHPDDRHKTAFWTPLGQMEWHGVPFGLLNGTSALARWLYLN